MVRKTDHPGEVTVCARCGNAINWASDHLFGPDNYDSIDEWESSRDDTTCPFCGSKATDYEYAD